MVSHVSGVWTAPTGVMNLLWVAILTGFVLAEKIAPAARWTTRIAGVLLIGWGLWMISTPR